MTLSPEFQIASADTAIGSTFALYPTGATNIQPLIGKVDGYLAEEHERSVSKTSYPVESGASLTDHAVRQPDKLKLEGWVSDLLPSDDADQGLALKDRATAAWSEIHKLTDAREPLTVVTRLKVYENMLITKASAPVNDRTGYGLRFSLDLEEVLFHPLRVAAGGLNLVPEPESPTADRVSETNRGDVESPNYDTPRHLRERELVEAVGSNRPTPNYDTPRHRRERELVEAVGSSAPTTEQLLATFRVLEGAADAAQRATDALRWKTAYVLSVEGRPP